MDPLAIKAAADELTTKTLPELIAAGNQLVDRLEKILERMNGAAIVFTLPEKRS